MNRAEGVGNNRVGILYDLESVSTVYLSGKARLAPRSRVEKVIKSIEPSPHKLSVRNCTGNLPSYRNEKNSYNTKKRR
jgi:hypothetical protein